MGTDSQYSSRAAVVKAMVSTVGKMGFITDPKVHASFLRTFQRECPRFAVKDGPKKAVVEMIREIEPVTEKKVLHPDPVVQAVVQAAATLPIEDPLDYLDTSDMVSTVSLNGLGGIDDITGTHSESYEGRPLTKAVRDYLTSVKFVDNHKVTPLGVNVTLNGVPCLLIATWKLEGVNNTFKWNLTGKITSPTCDGKLVHKCEEDVLYYENGRPVCVSDDFIWENFKVPSQFQMGASKFSGTSQVVRGAWFVWAFKRPSKKSPVMYRYWLNEETPGLKNDLLKKRVDLRDIK